MENGTAQYQTESAFNEREREAVYKAIFKRRDVRGEFKPDPVPDKVLARLLKAAHHAPSVGFMQPWDFILIRSDETRQKIHKLFETANREAEDLFEGRKRELYSRLKLEGILSSPVNLCITCDRSRSGPVVLGRTHDMAMDIYSSVCAVQNLWLAARAEGVGVGWVSIFDREKLKSVLGLPEHVIPVAYLCIGYVDDFHLEPELQTAGWRERMDLKELVFSDAWGKSDDQGLEGLLQLL